eukprot:894100-Pleurochrysis_carterae.AAC.2
MVCGARKSGRLELPARPSRRRVGRWRKWEHLRASTCRRGAYPAHRAVGANERVHALVDDNDGGPVGGSGEAQKQPSAAAYRDRARARW